MNARLSNSPSVDEVKKLHELNPYTAYPPANGLPNPELRALIGVAKENHPASIATVKYLGGLVFEEEAKQARSQIATETDNNDNNNTRNNKKPARPLSDK